ncbi:patatin-like phospholipase domain-containing protein 3 isoform X1, putative [Babesia ovis]|uniref:Patatin-like phospholipase domain-containing protein 3 isoform X1, putative n=1 Tax=Babesia ovis TaxID=5869 RepID=A0A9W5T908_BABOV|nr:patatin-like phospholipase domain-containing protein 3 isoform X1, putative [Babesia ovis]
MQFDVLPCELDFEFSSWYNKWYIETNFHQFVTGVVALGWLKFDCEVGLGRHGDLANIFSININGNVFIDFELKSVVVKVVRSPVPSCVGHFIRGAVNPVWLTHRTLDGKTANVVPVLLKETDQVVNGKNNVCPELFVGHLNVTNGNTHAKHLLQLELNTGLDLPNLFLHVVIVCELGREFTSLVKSGTEEPRNLGKKGLGGEESTVFVGKLLDQSLVPVELLESLQVNEVNAQALGLVTVHLVTENTDLHALTWNVLQYNSSAETLVPLSVIVLKSCT